MKIGFHTVDWYLKVPESSGFYRSYIPYRGLKRHGHETSIGYRMKATRFGWALQNPIKGQDGSGVAEPPADVFIFQRWMDAEAPYAVKWAQRRGQFVLADIDDWMFGLHHDNIAHTHLQRRKDTASSLAHYEELLRVVDGVICSTPFLAEQVRKRFNPNVAVVRNAIDPTLWPEFPRLKGGNPGWVGAVHWRSRDLEQLKGVIKPLLDKHDRPFVFVGFDGDDKIVRNTNDQVARLHERIGVDEEQVQRVRGTGPSRYPRLLAESPIGIGLVPLNDVAFNHAKSVAKGMEYAMANIPFIAYPTPEYQWLHDTYGVGILARRPRDWIKHIENLMTDSDLRRRHATWNRKQVLEHLTIDSTYVQYEQAIGELAQGACKDIRNHDTLLTT